MRMLSHGGWAKHEHEGNRDNCRYCLERAIEIVMHDLPPDSGVGDTLGAHLTAIVAAISACLRDYVTSNGGLVPHTHRYLGRNFVRNSAVARIGRHRAVVAGI